jgi:hypothetical protein
VIKSLIPVLSLLVSLSHAGDLTVDRLLEICESDNSLSHGECLGFFSGMRETIEFIQLEKDIEMTVCFPDNISSTRIKDVSINHLKASPKLRNFNAIVVLWPMYSQVFPCE